MVGLSWANDGAAPATGLVAFGVAMAAVFVVIESKSDYPIMPLEVYRNRTVAVSLTVVLLSAFGLYGSLLFTPLFFQVTLGTSAATSGRILAPIVVGLVIGNVLSGQLVARTGGYYRTQAVAGTAILATGMSLLSTMSEDTSLTWGMGCVFVAGIGVGGTLSTFRLAIQNSVPFRLVGAATAALQFCRLLSGTVGLAVLGAVLTRSLAARLDETLVQPLVVMSVIPFGLIGAVVGHFIMGHVLSMISLFGLVALSGVLVNDSLVLVDFINRAKRRGVPLLDAVLTGGQQRFRAIVLTSVTTVAGLSPILFEKSVQAQFLIPMAISMSFGLVGATALVLILVPALYLLLVDVQSIWRWLRTGSFAQKAHDPALVDTLP